MSKERFAEGKSELQNAIKRLREAVAQPESDLGVNMKALALRDKDLAVLRGAFRRCAKSVFLARAPPAMPAAHPTLTSPSPRRRRPPGEWAGLRDALENAPLIYELDLVRPERASGERLNEKIEREGIAIYPEQSAA